MGASNSVVFEFDLQLPGAYNGTMLVCHCHAISERTIRQCVDNGARSEDDVGEACGAGTGCGGCRPVVDRLIELHHQTRGKAKVRTGR